MADQPEDATTWFIVEAVVSEYRTYRVAANSQDEARVAVICDTTGLDYDVFDDVKDSAEILDVKEAEIQ